MPGSAITRYRTARPSLVTRSYCLCGNTPSAGLSPPTSSSSPTACRIRTLEPPLPPHRGPRERAVIRAALQGAFPALRIDA